MARTSLVCLALVLAACRAAPPSPAAATSTGPTQMRTLDSVDPRQGIADPPPMLADEAPPPKPKTMPWETPQPVLMTPEDEKLRASLPFSPAIAMDPVDGSKISMRAATPRVDWRGRIYYFSSEENKRIFTANPEQYTKSGFTKL